MSQDVRERLMAARNAIKAKQPERAIELTTNIIERRPAMLGAYLVRSDAHYAIGEPKAGIADLTAALSQSASPTPNAIRAENILLRRLLGALDSDRAQLMIASQGSIGGAAAPKAAAAVALLSFILAGNLKDARTFIAGLDENARSRFTARLAARLFLADEQLDAAIGEYQTLLGTEWTLQALDAEFLAMLDYRRAKDLRLRDTSLVAPIHRLAICASLKDEADNLEEWVVYHATIGVEAFYVYDNDSSDETSQILNKLAQRYRIYRRHVPHQPGQMLAFQHFIEFHRLDAEWVAFIDGDEFLNPAKAGGIHTVLDRNATNAAIAVNWANFGSSGHVSKPSGLCIEAFTRRARNDDSSHWMMKGIVRPHRIVRYLNPHCMVIFGNYGDGGGHIVFPFAQCLYPPRYDAIQVNHYAVKSLEQAEKKLKRGNPVPDTSPHKYRSTSYVEKFDQNELEDTSILKFAPAVRATLRGSAA